MEQTSKYGLSQWDAEDRILREDFNADNAKIEAALEAQAAAIANSGNCRIVQGSYVGKGTNGPNNAITLTFNGKPMVLFVSGLLSMTALRGAAYGTTNSGAITITTWRENSVSWYSDQAADIQMNSSGKTYQYIALIQPNG